MKHKSRTSPGTVEVDEFGHIHGQRVDRLTLRNAAGYSIEVLTYGAIWHAFSGPDPNGRILDVLVKPAELSGYLSDPLRPDYYFGASVGRYAGRIGGGGFSIGDTRYTLGPENEAFLHGGASGFSRKIWEIARFGAEPMPFVELRCLSPDGEEGFPGNVELYARYQLEGNSCLLRYYGTSDQDTMLNLTNHAYFNLSGRDGVDTCELQLDSAYYLEVDSRQIPTGTYLRSDGGPLDFAQSSPLGKTLEALGGIDHVFLLKGDPNAGHGAWLSAPHEGLGLRVTTNQSSIVVFTPRRLDFDGVLAPMDLKSREFPAICLEAQNLPDAPNHAHFPSALLKKGEPYHWQTRYELVTIQAD